MTKLRVDLDQDDRVLTVEPDGDGKVRVVIERAEGQPHVTVLDVAPAREDAGKRVAA